MRVPDSESRLAPIRASYFQRVRNIGDAIAPCLLESVTGHPAIAARSTEFPYILSIGSLLHTATPQSFVWGTGLIHPSAGTGNPDPARILAVRGKLTHAELIRNGVRVRDVPLGDPGILIARMLRDTGAVGARFSLGLVPHYFDRDHPFFLTAAKDPSVKVLNVCDPPGLFFAEMASCDAIASTSLHGLVFGEALGAPTMWLEVSDKVIGQGFKFADWFSLAGNPQREPMLPGAFASAADIIAACEPRQIGIDVDALVEALTPEVIEACSRTIERQPRMIPISACRARPLPLFIVSCNDAGKLQRMIALCRRQDRPVEIVIYDDGSDEPDAIALLHRLERDGLTVYHRSHDDASELWQRVNKAVFAFFRDWAEPSRYAVTRCDLDFSRASTAALDLYDDLLDRFPRADSAGPASGARAAGKSGVETVVNGRAGSAAERTPGARAIAPWRCAILDGGFELGFAVYRAGRPLLPTMKSLRVCDPH